MRIGVVVSVRLNPADTMSAIDIVKAAGLFFPGMSISGAVALAMSIAFEELRKGERIPQREGFEYSSMMEDFPDRKNNKQKRAYADQLYSNSMLGRQPSLEAVPTVIPKTYEDMTDEEKIAWQNSQLDAEDRLRGPANSG